MLAEALQAAVDAYTDRFGGDCDEHVHRLVVRNGYHEPRDVLTSAGSVAVTAASRPWGNWVTKYRPDHAGDEPALDLDERRGRGAGDGDGLLVQRGEDASANLAPMRCAYRVAIEASADPVLMG
jgi:hypothetical protein